MSLSDKANSPFTISDIEQELEKRSLERSLLNYVQWSFQKKTGGVFKLNYHHETICHILERVFLGEITRLIINMPPRYSKTEIAVKGFIEWCLAKVSDSKFIHLSYSDMLALDNSSQIREDIKSDWYQSHWKRKTKQDSDSKQKWYTEEGGGLYSTGTAGSITGFGAGTFGDEFGGAVIIDDPQKPSEAYSDDVRKKTNERLNNTILSRLNNPKRTPIIIIMQRLHEMDMTGFCLGDGTGDTWTHLSIPVIDEENRPLWEAKHDLNQLSQMKTADHQTFSAQYMQRPAPAEGALFKRSWFKFYRELPKMQQQILAFDYAVKEKTTSDYTVGICMGRVGADKYVIDMLRDKMNFPNACQATIAFCTKHPLAYKKIVENKANGPAIVDTLKKTVPGLVLVDPGADKVARANAVAPDVEAGNVYLPDPSICPWVGDFLAELTSFPFAPHDDIVDAFCYALAELRKAGVLRMPIAGHSNTIYEVRKF